MRQVAINELSDIEVKAMEEYLKINAAPGAIQGVYWFPLPDKVLAAAQAGHEKCGPFVFAIEIVRDTVIFELLVRSSSNLHCTCTSYATAEQRQYLLDFFDRMVLETRVKG